MLHTVIDSHKGKGRTNISYDYTNIFQVHHCEIDEADEEQKKGL